MSLTRGVRSLWPCPICLVPRDALSDVSTRYPLRTSKDSQAIINLARTKHTLEEREKTLKEYGLRDVDVSISRPESSFQLTIYTLTELTLANTAHRCSPSAVI